MKASLLSAVLASAVAVTPPRIELDLSAMSNAYQLDTPTYYTHSISASGPSGLTQPDGTAVGARQDWTERCPAGSSTTSSCPFPSAKAYDHEDNEVNVITRVFLVDDDGTTVNTQVENVNFNARSTYLFKYDASDRASNHAEQVVFALILDDLVAPTIITCNGAAETVEAASSWQLCAATATDNIDVSPAPTVYYTITQVSTGVKLVTNVVHATAVGAITTHAVGQFVVDMTATDSAGIYGEDAKNNVATASKAVLVKDTRAPYIDMHGSVGGTHECATTYSDEGATATDLLDTEALGQSITVTADNTVNDAVVGHYRVTYNAHDFAGNTATEQTRPVEVVDTTDPVVTLSGSPQIIHYAGEVFNDPGASCADTCDQNPGAIALTWSRPWDDKQLGDYIRTYTCTDASGNIGTNTRKFTIIDNSKPILTLVGDPALTVEASLVLEYTDDGATCEDYVDGALSHAVEVSGQVVNMRVPGTYVIRYDCQDLSGNQAVHITRSVVVEDTICPTITVQGTQTVYVEAGFPYVDAGATATDDLDQDITSKVWTDGDTVDTSNAFYSMRSCQGIKSAFAGAKDGIYYITTYVAQTQQYERQLVWCDMTATEGYTYLAVICGERTLPYTTDSDKQGDCPKHGMQMATFATAAGAGGDYDRAFAKFHDANLPTHSMYFPNHNNPTGTATTDYYLCSTNDAGSTGHTYSEAVGNTITSDKITRAEAGKYVIFYHVSDNAGNKECNTESRTVVVKDTLPPVITLHLRNQLIHTGAKLDSRNTAADVGVNPYLSSSYTAPSPPANNFMAEQSTVSTDAWVIGAAASAVTGLALIAWGSKN